MTRAVLIAGAIAIMVPLCATRDDPLKGYAPGTPVSCISTFANNAPTIVDNTTIIYRDSGARLYVTHPTGSCPALRPQTTLIIQRFGGQLCRNDQFQVLEPGRSIPSSICRFDRFTPYTKVKTPHDQSR